MFSFNEKLIGLGRIRNNAGIGQDHSFFRWEDDGTLFQIYDVGIEGRVRCVADGYGELRKPEKYGNGAIYAKKTDVFMLEKGMVGRPLEEYPPFPV